MNKQSLRGQFNNSIIIRLVVYTLPVNHEACRVPTKTFFQRVTETHKTLYSIQVTTKIEIVE
jgi:hypothetical protein